MERVGAGSPLSSSTLPSVARLKVRDVLDQRLAGDASLRGVMLESHLFDGCQALSAELRYGVSITDGCLGWSGTEAMLREAAERLRGGR